MIFIRSPSRRSLDGLAQTLDAGLNPPSSVTNSEVEAIRCNLCRDKRWGPDWKSSTRRPDGQPEGQDLANGAPAWPGACVHARAGGGAAAHFRLSARTATTAARGTTVAHEPITAVVVAIAHRIETRCSIMPTSFDCEWRRSTRPRRDGAWRQRLTSAAEATAPAPNRSAQSPAQGEAKANTARGRLRMSAIGWPMAAILARSIAARAKGAVVRKSGASSAESAIQDSAPASCAAITTKAGVKATPTVPVGPPLRQRITASGVV